MVKALIVGCACLAAAVTTAQSAFDIEYDMAWGGALADSFRSVGAEPNGSAYASVLATVNTAGKKAWKVVKYDNAGAVVWTREVFVPNQITVTPNHRVAVGPSNQVIVAAVISSFGGNEVSMARLSNAAGTVLWQHSFGRDLAVRPVVTATRVYAIVRGIAAAPDNAFLMCRNPGNGSLLWVVNLGANVDTASVRLRADGAGNAMVLSQKPTSCWIRKFDLNNGSMLWGRVFNELMESEFEFDVLRPSGNVIVGIASEINPRFLVLANSNGAILRTEGVTAPNNAVSGVAAGLSDSYYRFEQGVSGIYELRDVTGLPIIQGLFEDPDNNGLVDPCGQFHVNGSRFSPDTGQFEFHDVRCTNFLDEFFPVEATDISQNDMATAANAVFIVGDCDVDLDPELVNFQGRILKLTQQMRVQPDMFSVMKRVVPVALNTPAPGVLANDAGFAGAFVTLINTTVNGTLTFNSDGSFTYLPNSGFTGQDNFTYKLRIGANELTSFCAISVISIGSVTVPQPEVIGGNNLVGTVNLTAQNRNVPIIVQLSDNLPEVLVTSSIAIPFGMSSGPFNIITSPVAADSMCTITGTLQGVSRTAQLLIKRAKPLSLSLDPTSLVAGMPFTGTVVMDGKAPAGGYSIALTHSGAEIGMPTSMVVGAGASSGTFAGTTRPRSTTVTHVITATAGGVSKTANLTLNPGGLFSLTVTPTTMQGGLNATGRVNVAGIAPPGGTVVNLTVNGNKVQVPASVTVPAGQQFVTFVITTQSVVSVGTRTITATFGNITKTANLTLTP